MLLKSKANPFSGHNAPIHQLENVLQGAWMLVLPDRQFVPANAER